MGESKPKPQLVLRTRHERETARSDRRWFLFTIAGAAALVVLIFGAREVYHWTGPHPKVTMLMRRVRGFARWVIPHWRRGRKW